MELNTCPTAQQLQAFQLGDLAEPHLHEVGEHLDHCARCEALARTLDDRQDPILANIRLRSPGSSTRITGSTQPPPLAAATDRASWPQLRGYQVLSVLGQGGMAVVYKARQLDLGRLVALKLILGGAHSGAEALARFQNEAEAVARLQHPNLVQIYEIGRQESQLFLALEYVEGGSLRDHLAGTPQPPGPAAELVETLARAMHYAHERGIIHRDLKPGNILLQPQGTPPQGFGVPKISDFGLAKQLDRDLQLTRTGAVAGTPTYMAPEQAAARAALFGPGLDVYSLGVILYELLTGQVPLRGSTAVETVLLVLNQEPVPPRRLQPKLPRDLQTICLKCLEKEPRRRYATAAALADDLRRFLNGEPIAAQPVPVWQRAWKYARRQPLVASLLACIALLVVGGFAGVLAGLTYAVAGWQQAEQNEKAATAANAGLRQEKAEKEQEARRALAARDQEERARRAAHRARQEAEENLYFSRISQARLEWQLSHNMDGVRTLLDQGRPRAGQPDRRGWEWNYLHRLLRTDLVTVPAHTSWVNAVAFSPDGRLVASAGGGNPFYRVQQHPSGGASEVVLWDVGTGQQHQVLRGHTNLVVALAFSPDSRRLVSAGHDQVRTWDVATGAELPAPRWTPHLRLAVFSHDGQRLLTCSGREDFQTVTLWNVADGRRLHDLKGHRRDVTCAAFSADGKRLATGSALHQQGELILWDPATGAQVRRLERVPERIHAVAFSPDGALLLAGGQTTTLWDVAAGRALHTFLGHHGSIKAVAFRPDGAQVATSGTDRTVRLWSVRSGQEESVLRGHPVRALCMAYDPSGRMLASGDERGLVKVWDLTRPPEYLVIDGGNCQALAFDPAGRHVQFVRRHGQLRVVDAETRLVQREHALDSFRPWITPAAIAAFSADGRCVATVSELDPRTIRLWDAATGKAARVLGGADVPAEDRHTRNVYLLAFSKDGSRLASAALHKGAASPGREIKVWDTATGKLCASGLVGGLAAPGYYGGLALSADGQWLAYDEYVPKAGVHIQVCAAQQAQARLPAPRWSLDAVPAAQITSLAFSPDGQVLAAANGNADVHLWDLATGKEMHQLRTQPPFAHRLAFSPDSKRLAAVNREEVKLWDVVSGQDVLILRGSPPALSDVGFNPQLAWSGDGQRLAASNWNGTISLWDTEDRGTSQFQMRQRQAAAIRAFDWHLDIAAQAFKDDARAVFAFHWPRVRDAEPPDAVLRRERGVLHALQGHWQDAAADFRLALARQPAALDDDWSRTVCLQALAGDAAGARQTGAAMIRQLAGAPLHPDAQARLVRALALIDQAGAPPVRKMLAGLEQQLADKAYGGPWLFAHALALAHVRAGQLDEGLRWCQRSLAAKPADCQQAVSHLILALANHRLNRTDEARQWFDRADQWLQRTAAPNEHGRVLLHDVPDGLALLILHREARAALRP